MYISIVGSHEHPKPFIFTCLHKCPFKLCLPDVSNVTKLIKPRIRQQKLTTRNREKKVAWVTHQVVLVFHLRMIREPHVTLKKSSPERFRFKGVAKRLMSVEESG